jgi:hypothetical protein
LSTTLSAQDNTVTKAAAEEGWILLFDGESLFGWTPETPGGWRAAGGMLQPSSSSGHLLSNSAFGDFALTLEYRVASGEPDCAVFFRAAPDNPRQSGYQLQIGDTRQEWPTGSIVDESRARALRPEAGRWHVIEATVSGERASVRLDGYSVAEAKNLRGRAGLVGLSCQNGSGIQIRNVKLRPLEMKPLFNGTDLSGWKVIKPPPPPKGGFFGKIIPGGGAPKEAAWSVVNRMIHAENGTGQIETAPSYDDFVLQLTVRVNPRDRDDRPVSSVFIRGEAERTSSGYEIQNGGLASLQPARKALVTANQFFTQTIAVHGRHIQVWIDGVPVADFQDTRAEGGAPQKGARTAAGTIGLHAKDERSNLDFRSVRVLQLPKGLGKATATTLTSTPAVAAGAGAPGASAAAPGIDPTRPQVQALMKEALATSDPAKQVEIFGSILVLDPNNQVAFNGRQQAQQKLDESNALKAKETEARVVQAQTAVDNRQNGETARQGAEDALVNGDLARAQTFLSTAEQLLPGDPRLSALRTRVDQAVSAQDRLRYALTGAGALALIAAVGVFIRSRGNRQKVPFLEVVEGVDKGKRYFLDQAITRIGAIRQDGGNTNEIVLRDVERMISRFHCEIHTRGKEIYLIDNGSANGTMLDKTRLEAGKAVRVKRGGRIDLGGTCVLKLGMQKRAGK